MYIELGEIVGVWGITGWIKLKSFTHNRLDISNYPFWWLQMSKTQSKQSSDPVRFNLLKCRSQGQGIVAQLDGIDNRNEAKALTGYRILVREVDLPKLPDNKFYWKQLIGLTIVNDVQTIGRICKIIETGANDVLVVERGEEADILIPYIDSVIKQVDVEQGTLIVDWDLAWSE